PAAKAEGRGLFARPESDPAAIPARLAGCLGCADGNASGRCPVRLVFKNRSRAGVRTDERDRPRKPERTRSRNAKSPVVGGRPGSREGCDGRGDQPMTASTFTVAPAGATGRTLPDTSLPSTSRDLMPLLRPLGLRTVM